MEGPEQGAPMAKDEGVEGLGEVASVVCIKAT